MDVANTIEKVKQIESESQSHSSLSIREDAISQVLGQDRLGQVRALRRGANHIKCRLFQARDAQHAQFQMRISELEEKVRILKKNQVIGGRSEGCTSQSNCGKVYDKCDLLDWSGTDEIVAEGRVVSSDPYELGHRIPLGPNAKVVLIEFPRKLNAFLWRATPNSIHIGEAVGMSVAWHADRVIFHTVDQFDNASETSSTYTTCKLYDWTGSEELVAEGRLYSSDPKQLVNDIPLGSSAVLVSIDNLKNSNAYLWRPTSGMIHVREAVGCKVAWPESKVVIEKVIGASSPTNVSATISPTTNLSATVALSSAKSNSKNKCKLIDVKGIEIVAKGRVASTDSNEFVHFVPLGTGAVKVWVENAKIPDAVLWRPSSNLECIEDAICTTVAWPVVKIVVESSSSNRC